MAQNEVVISAIPPLRYVANDSVKLYLLKLMKPQFTDKGHYLVKEGQVPDRIVFLVDGGAVICRVPLDTLPTSNKSSSPRKSRMKRLSLNSSPSKNKRNQRNVTATTTTKTTGGSAASRNNRSRLESIHEGGGGGASTSNRSDYDGIEGNNDDDTLS